jgi:steroid 5-alpha reductase family enzyme
VEQAANNKNVLTLVDWILLGGFLVSILLEIISDVQKTAWVENGRQGNFCRVGLWKYSRHPNYAGEIFQWWFAAAFAARSGYKPVWIVFLSPLFTMNILLNLSGTGILNAEGKNLKRYYEAGNAQEYKAYREGTSPLIPMIGYKSIPMSLRRALLFEFKSYEYNPPKDD